MFKYLIDLYVRHAGESFSSETKWRQKEKCQFAISLSLHFFRVATSKEEKY